jgi:hypothetical protein
VAHEQDAIARAERKATTDLMRRLHRDAARLAGAATALIDSVTDVDRPDGLVQLVRARRRLLRTAIAARRERAELDAWEARALVAEGGVPHAIQLPVESADRLAPAREDRRDSHGTIEDPPGTTRFIRDR